MKKIVLISLILILQFQLLIAEDKKNEFCKFKVRYEDQSYLTTERYEDILNFSKYTPKLNLYSPSIEVNQYERYTKLYLNLGQGYIYINPTWDLEYSVEKNFVTYQKKDEGDKDYNGWEVDFLLRNYLHNFDWVDHTWSRSWGFGASFSDGGDLEYDLFDEKTTDIFLTHRISTSFENIGLGGSYLSITTNGGGVISSVKDNGYRVNLILSTSTNWGYGFQTYNSLINEIRSYGHYDNTYMLDFTTVTSWTYELSHDFAFITELYFQSENFFNGTNRPDRIEFNIFPHIGYNKKLNDSFRFFAKLGVTPISIIKYSDGYDDSGFFAKGVLGITYRW